MKIDVLQKQRRLFRASRCGVGLAMAIIAAACGANSADGGDKGAGGSFASGAGGGFAGTTATGMGGAPPEKEVESTYGAPVATGKYVWIANPTSGRVAYIDATTLEIKLVDAGNGPTFVAPIPDPKDDVAIVLNVLSLDATVLRAASSGLTAVSVPVPSSGNAWSVSSDGRWAIAWTDARRVSKPDPVNGYQDITVLDLTVGAEKSFELTVGYRPVAIAFDSASSRAFAITQDGISVVSLTGGPPAVVKNIALSSGAPVDAGTSGTPADGGTSSDAGTIGPMPNTGSSGTSDVAITPDGAYAIVRRDGVAAVSVFTLADGTRTDVTMPGVPTDLDLSPDGKTAVAVIRDTSQVALLPVPGIVTSPATVSMVKFGATIGSASLALKSGVAFFYTNATPSSVLGVMDTSAASPTPRTIQLRAPILGVFPTPDAAHALVLHDALSTEGSQFPAAFSLAPIALDLPPKIVGIDAPPISIAVSPAGDHALVAAGDDTKSLYELVIGDMPSLAIRKLPLASLPIAAGIVAGAGRGYVAQKHPDGRITFVDLASGQARTLTGFELATQVVDGTP